MTIDNYYQLKGGRSQGVKEMQHNDPQQRFETIVKKMRESKHKLTPQRLEGHPSVEAIYEQLRDDYPTMSLATVYRSVMLMKSLGEVLELGFPDSGNRYDGNKPYPHPHVICVRCKKILDPELASLKDLTREVTAASGYKILTHRMDFFGLCRACQGKDAAR